MNNSQDTKNKSINTNIPEITKDKENKKTFQITQDVIEDCLETLL